MEQKIIKSEHKEPASPEHSKVINEHSTVHVDRKIKEMATAAYNIHKLDTDLRFMTSEQKMRNEKISQLLKQIIEACP